MVVETCCDQEDQLYPLFTAKRWVATFFPWLTPNVSSWCYFLTAVGRQLWTDCRIATCFLLSQHFSKQNRREDVKMWFLGDGIIGLMCETSSVSLCSSSATSVRRNKAMTQEMASWAQLEEKPGKGRKTHFLLLQQNTLLQLPTRLKHGFCCCADLNIGIRFST